MAQILVVDDEPQLRALLRLILAREGHDVREAADGEGALQALEEAPADLVLCDLFMPERDGLETMRELARTRPALPVVVMSGGGRLALTGLLPVAAELGAAGTLPKPFDRRTLLDAVGRALGSSPEPSESRGGRPSLQVC